MSAAEESTKTAKLFMNGRSQAVRLPKEFRFEGQTEVRVHREGERVVLEPVNRAESEEEKERDYFRRLTARGPSSLVRPEQSGPSPIKTLGGDEI
ncbi:hypothetical protein BH23VER1_BH23VER1_13280 [soil metagenome]